MPATRSRAAYSLRARLLLAFGIVLVLFLGLAGIVLERSFSNSVMAAMEERLQLQVYALLGVAEIGDDGMVVPDLEEPRYRQIDSGLYAMILDARGRELWRSPSALNLSQGVPALAEASLEPGNMAFGHLDDPALGELAYARYDIVWASRETRYRFVVFESTAPAVAEIREFQGSLWFWLGGLVLLLSLVQLVLLHWGLGPIKRLAVEVQRVERGDQDALNADYPRELYPLSDNMNRLIRGERDRQARYQRTLGDLAHSLKTPLAVIAGIVEDRAGDTRRADDDAIHEQVQRMNQIVSYQLNRAVQSAGPGWAMTPVPVVPVIEKVLGALNKVYREKGVTVQTRLDANARFPGEENDLMELCGNILDNAFKYTNTLVRVAVEASEEGLVLTVEDDGPGVSEDRRRWILRRGARADTLTSGQGIGLSVVVEIVAHYGGELELDRSPEGGAGIRLRFPMPARERAS